jgi:hypothetical protein
MLFVTRIILWELMLNKTYVFLDCGSNLSCKWLMDDRMLSCDTRRYTENKCAKTDITVSNTIVRLTATNT